MRIRSRILDWKELERIAADGLAAVDMDEAPRRCLEAAGGVRICALSPFVLGALQRDAEVAAWLGEDDRLHTVNTPRAVRERVSACAADVSDATGLMRALRRQRQREMVLIAWRDLAGKAALEESLEALSALAEACLVTAHDRLDMQLAQRHGTPRDEAGEEQSLVVLALGKLGGGELNFSSDIDLIFAFPAGGQTDGERSLDNETYFTRLGRDLIRVLDEPTADGRVFRVDMRLRPFGASGPLAVSFNAMETYYQLHGREWERYALIKARPVAGDIPAGEVLLSGLQPFIYRRYFDYSVFGALREMKQGIRREVQRKGLEDNIKLGRGGIREIEFIVQLYQLIRGGREPELRTRSLLRALEGACRNRHIGIGDAEALEAAYCFLRRLENRLQAMHDRQTHALPGGEDDRLRLAVAMGCDRWEDLAERFEAERSQVRRIFDEVFVGPALPGEGADEANPFADLWQNRLPEEARRALLRRTGFGDGEAALASLDGFRRSHAVRRMGDRGRLRLDRLMPALFSRASKGALPQILLERLLRVIEAIATRTAYLALLVENTMALEHLARLCEASPWITERIARHPLLLDELIDPRIFRQPPSPEAHAAELDEMLAPADGDLERQMDLLREFQQAAVLRVAAADISGLLDAEAVSGQLSALAELILRRVLVIAWEGLAARHGQPRCHDPDARAARFVVVAYGKLGSVELGYGSDLDLVFLHDSDGEQQQTDGDRPLDNALFFSRLAQRVIHLITTQTPAGVLYEVDTRLRPSGSAGLLVSGLTAFADYQRRQAWTWEHQALLRARVVAGDAALAQGFAVVRRELLTVPRPAETLAGEVREMRRRMLREAGNGEGFDPKRDAGGLTDVEFLVQYWTLRHAAGHPELLEHTGGLELLGALADAGCIPAGDAATLAEATQAFRESLHRLTLSNGGERLGDDSLKPHREAVREIWERELGGEG
jgi:glutamate-ammonia-ligase adenylyltransferase